MSSNTSQGGAITTASTERSPNSPIKPPVFWMLVTVPRLRVGSPIDLTLAVQDASRPRSGLLVSGACSLPVRGGEGNRGATSPPQTHFLSRRFFHSQPADISTKVQAPNRAAFMGCPANAATPLATAANPAATFIIGMVTSPWLWITPEGVQSLLRQQQPSPASRRSSAETQKLLASIPNTHP